MPQAVPVGDDLGVGDDDELPPVFLRSCVKRIVMSSFAPHAAPLRTWTTLHLGASHARSSCACCKIPAFRKPLTNLKNNGTTWTSSEINLLRPKTADQILKQRFAPNPSSKAPTVNLAQWSSTPWPRAGRYTLQQSVSAESVPCHPLGCQVFTPNLPRSCSTSRS